MRQNDQKARCQKIFSSSMKRAPKILLPQGYLRVNSSTKSFSRTPVASLLLLLEIPSFSGTLTPKKSKVPVFQELLLPKKKVKVPVVPEL